MANLAPLQYDPANVETMDFKVIPPGIYPVVIVDSDVTDTKKKTEKCWSLNIRSQRGNVSATL